MSGGEEEQSAHTEKSYIDKLQCVTPRQSVTIKQTPSYPLIGNKLLMHDAMIYLQDPAHPELPERAQPPSALRLLVQSPLFPDGGDVIRWLGQQVTGPGTGRHKLRVRFQKKKKKGKKDQIFV